MCLNKIQTLKFIKPFCAIVLCAITLYSCKKDTDKKTGDTAFFGGEVINPLSDFVILYNPNQAIDTIPLNDSNRFELTIPDPEQGLYTFKLQASDGMEYQTVLLESQDSVMCRINTMEFDESLVFTGSGAKKNNYLINLFLENEKEDKTVLGFSQLPAAEFEKKIDSIRSKKQKTLDSFSSKNTTSELFNDLVKTNIDYNYYLSKEVYPFVNYTSTERNIIETLPKNFYKFRSKVDYNKNNLVNFAPYYSFLVHHLENIALTEHFKTSTDSTFNKKSLDYNLIKLELIDSLISNDSIKNSLLIRAAVGFISNNKDVADYDALLESFTEKSSNPNHKEYVSNIINSLKNLKPGNKLPNLTLVDINNIEVSLNKVIKKPTVLYFWSSSHKTHINSHAKARELKIKYPEINFIAINTDKSNESVWKNIVKQYHYATTNEFIFKHPKEAKHSLAIYPINKVMIINKNGNIVNAHTNMFSIHFEEQLLSLLNQ